MLTPLTDSLDAALITELRAAGATVEAIGASAEGRRLHGISIGARELPLVSIVAGAHPDEPAGPVAALELIRTWPNQPLAHHVRLAVVPLLDVDGVIEQQAWLKPWTGAVDPARYLAHSLRRQPGADREFAWPGAPWGGTVLAECQAAAAFLDQHGAAIAHLSLHGMAIAHGPWYLLDHLSMTDGTLWLDLRRSAADLGLPLHEFYRHGDKGFRRAGLGFCTTPSGPAMRRAFLHAGDRATAAGFGYGSMDSARARAARHHAPPPLCAVSEFPLLLSPPDLAIGRGSTARQQIDDVLVHSGPAAAATTLGKLGLRPLPLNDQVTGMLTMVSAVIHAARRRYC
ncbi:MAG: M14 family zinc carboxypeptidase [Planctomycetota bacterium]|jgi:hypothetical protein